MPSQHDKNVLLTKDFVLFRGGWLSQWTKAPFTLDGVDYSCCEQFMMAEKARVFGDHQAEASILSTRIPMKQKALGRKVVGFQGDVWESVCRGIVYSGNLARYEQNEEFRGRLMATGKRTIVESSPRDRVWGIGRGPAGPLALVPSKWRGRNWLGIAIMQVRDELRRRQGRSAPAFDQELRTQLDRREVLPAGMGVEP